MITTKVFFNSLEEKVPELRPLYEEHQSYYDELLPHLLMADITRFVLELASKVRSNSRKSEQKLTLILESLEEGMKLGDEDVTNFIAVSFLENLEQDDPNYSFLKNQFGDELKNHVEIIENW